MFIEIVHLNSRPQTLGSKRFGGLEISIVFVPSGS